MFKVGDKIKFKFDFGLFASIALGGDDLARLEKHQTDEWEVISNDKYPTGELTINKIPCILLYNPACKSNWDSQSNGFFIAIDTCVPKKKRKLL